MGKPEEGNKRTCLHRQVRSQTHVGTREEMNSRFVHQFFSINRMCLLTIGLWPYQQSKFVQFQRIVCVSILSSFIMFQLTTFLTTNYNYRFVIKMFSSISLFIIYLMVYCVFWIKSDIILQCFDVIQNTYKELRDDNEFAIIDKYEHESKLFSTVIIVCGILFVIIVQPVWPHYFNDLLFGNSTQAYRGMNIITEYFVDSEKYVTFILLHNVLAFCVGAATVIANGTLFLTLSCYIYGMLTVASYRIQQTLGINLQQNGSKRNMKKSNMIREHIISAVKIHREAIELFLIILNTFEKMSITLIMIIVGSMSFSLFRIFQLMSFEKDPAELLAQSIYFASLLLYLFCGCYLCQELTDHNTRVFLTVYDTYWYAAPLRVQWLILFLLQRGTKPVVVRIGKIIIGSLETFATLTSASISYFTVMYSTQQKS